MILFFSKVSLNILHIIDINSNIPCSKYILTRIWVVFHRFSYRFLQKYLKMEHVFYDMNEESFHISGKGEILKNFA